MSADFWAGYASGAVGIIIGNPLDIVKVRLQASSAAAAAANISPPRRRPPLAARHHLLLGTTAPILGYGALNALLFVSYNHTLAALSTPSLDVPAGLGTTFVAGAAGGLATWAISTPTELLKCRAQVAAPSSCWAITKAILRTHGIRGLYLGGAITAWRDCIGYGFYFWTYELTTRWASRSRLDPGSPPHPHLAGPTVLLSGGLAGVASWASVFPLDAIKTRMQTQSLPTAAVPSATCAACARRLGAIDIARDAYHNEGPRFFFRGLAVCSMRAFLVNAVQWLVYEWVLRSLDNVRGMPTPIAEN